MDPSTTSPLPKFRYVNQGLVEPFLDFKVDNFYGGGRKGKFTFFLSHMHEGRYINS